MSDTGTGREAVAVRAQKILSKRFRGRAVAAGQYRDGRLFEHSTLP